jgi:addiction module HigA family antidote
MAKKLDLITPGEILLEEFMKPYGVSQNKLARDLDIPLVRVNDLVHNKRGITPDTAFRLGTYFKTSPEFWLNLQNAYDVKRTEEKSGTRLRASIRPLAQAAGGEAVWV